MSEYPKPIDGRKETFEVFARHVSKGKVETFEKYGFDAVMGDREGPLFKDSFSDRAWYNWRPLIRRAARLPGGPTGATC